jgi:hypothetical protein
MNIFRTFNIPADMVATAQKVADALGNGHQGMFRAPFDSDEDGPAVDNAGFISSGVIDDQSPMIQGRAAMKAALVDTDVTEAEIDAFADVLDLTDADPFTRIEALKGEIANTVAATDWVQPAGSEDAYPFGALVKHNGSTWVSLQDANVFEPGVASWRKTYATATDEPPAWAQPVGASDAYPVGARVTHNGETWVNTSPANVFEPGVFGWEQEEPSGPSVEPWVQGGGSGTAGSYLQDYRWSADPNDTQVIEVTHPNAQDGGNVWLFPL